MARPIWWTRSGAIALPRACLGAETDFPSPRDTHARTVANVVNAAMIPIKITSAGAVITPLQIHEICNASTLSRFEGCRIDLGQWESNSLARLGRTGNFPEAMQGEAQKDPADQCDDDELRPNHRKTSAAIEDRLRERHEMRRG